MAKKPCAACQKLFVPHPRVPQQRYCSAPACQKVRRCRWQRQKLQSDSDYRDNQARAQRQWRQRRPDYWRRYRQSRPDYTTRNRQQQRQRNDKRRHPEPPAGIAKMDALDTVTHRVSGTYWLVPATPAGIAKMDAYMVELTFVSTPSG